MSEIALNRKKEKRKKKLSNPTCLHTLIFPHHATVYLYVMKHIGPCDNYHIGPPDITFT